ncbi:Gfo/Idh/MocA family oxidoreductase [Desulfopila sp. IMCC35008]|uniref:Gfo/Idh/MocA family oxidoreductase n=1 Tax=Desulfopila sp. IMCC35008 TaxID=2653858 RepID=UPI0013D2C291|nr:Gfo/Idh/MocA family oxidoreductase [Desulfopila sp. IMCC35008]
MTQIKAAILGFGLSGAIFHAPFLEAADRFELAVILQRKGESAARAYPRARIAGNLESVLGDKSIELVVVGTPNALHFEMARQALLAGKHVIVDKPFTPTVAEAQELIGLARKKGLHLFVFHNRRWDGDFMTLRMIIEEGKLGEIVSYDASYDRYAPSLNSKPWKETAGPGISILHDLGTHIIDQAVCLFGRPEAVTGHLVTQREGSSVSDGFTVRLHYSGLHATLRSSLLVLEEGPRYVIHGRNGSFVKYGVDPQEDDMQAGCRPLDSGWGEDAEEKWGVLHTRVNSVSKRETVPTLPGNYMHFYDNVAAVIRDGAPIAMTAEEALVTVRIIEAVQESHREGRTIKI